MKEIVQHYLATWNADRRRTGGAAPRALVTRRRPTPTRWPRSPATCGRGGSIDAVQDQFPGFVFTQVAEADAHHRQLRFPGASCPGAEDRSWSGSTSSWRRVRTASRTSAVSSTGSRRDLAARLRRCAPPATSGSDPEIRRISSGSRPTFAPYGGVWVVHGGRLVALEGAWNGDVVIWVPEPGRRADWYASPAYQATLPLRTGLDSLVALVEGVPDAIAPPTRSRSCSRADVRTGCGRSRPGPTPRRRPSSSTSASWRSIARRVPASRLALKRPAGSSSEAPLAKVSLTLSRYVSTVQIEAVVREGRDAIGVGRLAPLGLLDPVCGSAARIRERTFSTVCLAPVIAHVADDSLEVPATCHGSVQPQLFARFSEVGTCSGHWGRIPQSRSSQVNLATFAEWPQRGHLPMTPA